MLTTVTMRPRKLSTPAISLEASGTRVSRSGMNTSCTREMGRPNNCPPITAVTYSATVPSLVWSLLVISNFPYAPAELRSCRAAGLGGLFFQRRDQARTVELGDVVMEAGEPSALDGGRRHQRGQRDNRHCAQMLVGTDGLGEFEPIHVGHLDIGQHHIEGLPRAQRSEAFLRVGDHPHPVTGRLDHRRQHIAEEG